MPIFNYSAVAPDVGPINGSIEASSPTEARQLLAERGLEEIVIERPQGQEEETQPATATASNVRFSQAEQSEVLGQIGDIILAGLPLSVSLRALAEEVPNQRIRTAFLAMSQDLDVGLDLDVAFANQSSLLPSYLTGLVRAGRQSGDLARSFGQYTEFVRMRDRMSRNLQSSLLYPLSGGIAGGLLFLFLLGYIVPLFREIFRGFGTELPGLTDVLIRTSSVVELIFQWWPASLVFGVLLVLMTPRLFRAAMMSESGALFLYAVPIFGTMWRNRSHAEFAQLLAMMVENDLPLPTALRLAGDGVNDGYVRASAYRMSDYVQQGISLVEAARLQYRLSPSFVQALICGRQDNMLPGSLRVASEHFAAQTLVDSRMAGLGMEPLIVLVLGGSVALLVVALFMPLVKLLNDLS